MSLPQSASRVSSPRRWRPLAAAALAVALSVVAPAKSPGTILFHGDFDDYAAQLAADVGTFYAFATDKDAIQLVADGTAGNKLVFDDTFSATGVASAIACAFEGGAVINSGDFSFAAEVTLSASALPFVAGIVIDAPQSDMVPVSGPDGDGILIIGSTNTGAVVPPGVPLTLEAKFHRGSVLEDWTFAAVVTARDQNGAVNFSAHGNGRVIDSAGKPIVALAFQKSPGITGQVGLDDISALVPTSISAGKPR